MKKGKLSTAFKSFFGFTLAEVLITLAIIGVVAAMTIPTLVNKINDRRVMTSLSRNEAILANAYKLALKDEEDPTGWGLTDDYYGSTQLGDRLSAQIKYATNCGAASSASKGKKCWANTELKYVNGSKINGWNLAGNNKYYKILLLDGTSLAIRAQSENCTKTDGVYQKRCGYVLIDVDGPNKGDTRLGYDVFELDFTKDSTVHIPCTTSNGSEGWCLWEWINTNKNLSYKNCPSKWDKTTLRCK